MHTILLVIVILLLLGVYQLGPIVDRGVSTRSGGLELVSGNSDRFDVDAINVKRRRGDLRASEVSTRGCYFGVEVEDAGGV